ncbi:hypothetical protein L6452_04750 [Arctium lappa]|uniref:Uncharacterized protein n=1 Tax=Arctium lappa TaxID=4217 RepID=A0ACB9EEK9_ARCLA|nr:hypothetical protein L6452_04750 [Arctium lappa]
MAIWKKNGLASSSEAREPSDSRFEARVLKQFEVILLDKRKVQAEGVVWGFVTGDKEIDSLLLCLLLAVLSQLSTIIIHPHPLHKLYPSKSNFPFHLLYIYIYYQFPQT